MRKTRAGQEYRGHRGMEHTSLRISPLHGYLGLHSRRCACPFPWPRLTHRESCDMERAGRKEGPSSRTWIVTLSSPSNSFTTFSQKICPDETLSWTDAYRGVRRTHAWGKHIGWEFPKL